MDAYLGIDLGSTTSKACLVDGQGRLLGRAITNTRSNYDMAAQVVRDEALADARFSLAARATPEPRPEELAALRRAYGVEEALVGLGALRRRALALCAAHSPAEEPRLAAVFDAMASDADATFGPLASDRSRFFRDAVGSRFFATADELSRAGKLDFDAAASAYDRAIVEVENSEPPPAFEQLIGPALARAPLDADGRARVSRALTSGHAVDLRIARMVGTGYGRQRLPFPKDQIQSEILCHGMGAHAMFPLTRTVLDIGGQDTKAIQLDGEGLVKSFQMNDRCAAGCGRYLGYIADEMNLGVHELGPLAMSGSRAVKISSTCTVFAGVELRELLSTGERRENILQGLHRAIVLRAMSLLARSGGVSEQMTFTGGVAKNDAVVHFVRQLVQEHYGDRTINIHTDSIYTGALGAALFAARGSDAAAAAHPPAPAPAQEARP